jgi:hypothetical protein
VVRTAPTQCSHTAILLRPNDTRLLCVIRAFEWRRAGARWVEVRISATAYGLARGQPRITQSSAAFVSSAASPDIQAATKSVIRNQRRGNATSRALIRVPPSRTSAARSALCRSAGKRCPSTWPATRTSTHTACPGTGNA